MSWNDHVFDPASVFLSKRDLYSKQKRPEEQKTVQIPDCVFDLPVPISWNDPVVERERKHQGT